MLSVLHICLNLQSRKDRVLSTSKALRRRFKLSGIAVVLAGLGWGTPSSAVEAVWRVVVNLFT